MKTIHGGDIYRNHVKIDYSVNVNPLGIPQSVRQAILGAMEQCRNYPDIHAEQLKTLVGRMHGISPDMLIFGNGASELFLAVIHALKPEKIVIPVPSFYGYEHAASASGAFVYYVPLREETRFYPGEELLAALDHDTDMLFLANPNNPTGVQIKEDDMKKLLQHCLERKITVVLDECFMEFCENPSSMVKQIESFPNLILIRAFTKSFSIPGVRLGYLICGNERIREAVMRHLPEWNLSVFAQAAGAACTHETHFLQETILYLNRERKFLTDGIRSIPGFCDVVYPSAVNFLLLSSSKPLYSKLSERGILIRDCGNFRGLSDGFYRIAVKTREENEEFLRIAGEINWNE